MLLAVLLAQGCSGGASSTEIPATHPAHPEAEQAVFELPPNVLGDEAAPAVAKPEDARQQDERVGLSPEASEHLTRLLDAYTAIGDALAADKIAGIAERARQIHQAAGTLSEVPVPGSPHFWHERAGEVETLRSRAAALARAHDIRQARVEYGHVSDALERIVSATGAGDDLHAFVCGMYKDAPRKGIWLQPGDEPRNPYFGAKMLRCHAEAYAIPGANTGQNETGGKVGE